MSIRFSLLPARGDDLVAQTRDVFEQAAKRLSDEGLAMSDIVKTVDFTTPSTLKDYRRTGPVRREMLTEPYPAAAGILLDSIPDGALVQLDVWAESGPKETVNPGWPRYEKLTYSPALRSGSTLWLSGQAALDPSTEQAVHAGDVVAQADYTYANIVAVLRAGDLGPEHVTEVVEYVTPAGLSRYEEVDGIRRTVFGDTEMIVTRRDCAALLRPEFEIEIEATAVYPA